MGATDSSTTAPRLEITIATLGTLDQLVPDVIAVFFPSDVRPLKGICGLLDWRMCGAISRAIEAGLIEGAAGESVLMPVDGRMGRRRLFAFGLGETAAADGPRLAEICQRAMAVLRKAGATDVVAVAPQDRSGQLEKSFVRALQSSDAGLVSTVLVEG